MTEDGQTFGECRDVTEETITTTEPKTFPVTSTETSDKTLVLDMICGSGKTIDGRSFGGCHEVTEKTSTDWQPVTSDLEPTR